MVAARSEAKVEAMACSEAGDEAAVCSGLGSRMAGGGSTDSRQRWHDMSRATEERERVRGQKVSMCGERERGA
jgi:hypothetical protein